MHIAVPSSALNSNARIIITIQKTVNDVTVLSRVTIRVRSIAAQVYAVLLKSCLEFRDQEIHKSPRRGESSRISEGRFFVAERSTPIKVDRCVPARQA
jgi:hypothetical protein